LRLVLALAVALALPVPVAATAALKTYDLAGDLSNLFPTDGTLYRPGTVSGTAVIDDPGDGTPSLLRLELAVNWTDVIGASDLGPPGTTVLLEFDSALGPAPDQTGTGGTSDSISWGALSGWTSTGFVSCHSNCPGGCGGFSACINFVGFEGTGAAPPLASTAFDSDPWTFADDMRSLESAPIRYLDLAGGVVTGTIDWVGTLRSAVPLLPLAGVGLLGAALVGLGACALRRTPDVRRGRGIDTV